MAKQIIITEVANLITVEGKSRSEIAKIYGLNGRQEKMLFSHEALKGLRPAPGLVIIDDTKEEMEEISYSNKGEVVNRRKITKKDLEDTEKVETEEAEVPTENVENQPVEEQGVEATVVENPEILEEDTKEESSDDSWFNN